MNVCIIGTGYVGLPTGVGLAELGNNVICVDRERSKIEALQAGKLTLYEEGLEELFHRNAGAGRLRFTTSMKEAWKRRNWSSSRWARRRIPSPAKRT